ncbi:hypothetical protein [Bacillus cabrialesii]
MTSDKVKGATGHGRREYCSIVLMLLKKTAALNGCFIVPENFVHRKMTKYDGFRKGNDKEVSYKEENNGNRNQKKLPKFNRLRSSARNIYNQPQSIYNPSQIYKLTFTIKRKYVISDTIMSIALKQ